MRKFSCLVAVAMAIGCGDDEPRMEVDAGPGVDMAGLDMEISMVDMGDDPVDMGSDPVDMAGEETPDLGDDPPDMGGEDVDMFTPDPSCDDGVLNGDETGIDCGGETCEDRCGPGAVCGGNADCQSLVCISGTCQAASCSDGIQNGSETGRDCGGPDCDGCGLGESCDSMDDCAMGMCDAGFCVADHCFNSMRDANETAVDCGGPDCAPCSAGDRCTGDGDCGMGTCIDNFCRTAACTNGTMDAGEVGVDCGGECPGCDDGASCTMNADCLSNRCDMMVCTSCGDGTQNGMESDVDCGGDDCRPCFGGEICATGTDCTSGICTGGLCEGGASYYDEDFGAGDGGWTAGGADLVWEYAMPADAHIAMAYTGTAVWVTDADASYPANSDGYVESPAIDLSAVTNDPTLELAFITETEDDYDGMWIELSTDGGTSWDKLLDDGNAVDWYNNAEDVWWDDVVGWTVASAVLTGAAGNDDVRLRVHFSSDFSGQFEGVAFDDVRVFEDLCSNGILDPGETDVDCGGECGTCVDGSPCVMDTDCESMRCDANICTSCSDGIQNGPEAAVDCGGGMCALCVGGTPCTDDSICETGMCDTGFCVGLRNYYYSDFETDDGGLIASGTTPGWEHGEPAGSVVSSASSGANAWMVDLDADYTNNSLTYLELPELDFSAETMDPAIAFDLWRRSESSYDGAWIETSIDEGTTWTKLEDDGSFMNWYNNPPSEDGWWDAEGTGWEPVSGLLTGTAGEASVRIRFVFDSDGSATRDGPAIDDLRVGGRSPNLEVSIVPSSDICSAGNIMITNVGSARAQFFDLTTVVDGSSSTDRIMVSLAPGQTFNATISATSSLEASIYAPGDPDASNDSATLAIEGAIAVMSGARYLETFESDAGGWLTAGTHTDWAWGMPDGTFIGSADSGTNAWVTNLEGAYSPDQQSYLTSPCFDLSRLAVDPVMSFSRIFELEPTDDNVAVEITTDGGVSWSKLGTASSGTNWYNDLLGDFWDGVSGAPDFWSRSAHPLVGGAGQARVRVRFVFTSDASTNEDGFGVDDVIIQP